MAYPPPPKRGASAVRIVVWVILGIGLGILLCCGALFLGGTVSPGWYR
jgi:hypothetical protein